VITNNSKIIGLRPLLLAEQRVKKEGPEKLSGPFGFLTR